MLLEDVDAARLTHQRTKGNSVNDENKKYEDEE